MKVCLSLQFPTPFPKANPCWTSGLCSCKRFLGCEACARGNGQRVPRSLICTVVGGWNELCLLLCAVLYQAALPRIDPAGRDTQATLDSDGNLAGVPLAVFPA